MSYELTTRIRDFPSSGCPEFGFIYGSSRNFLLLHSSRFFMRKTLIRLCPLVLPSRMPFAFITSFRTPVKLLQLILVS